MTHPAASPVDRLLTGLLPLAIAAIVGTWVAAALLLAMDADEAWILLSTAHSVGIAVPETLHTGQPTVTTGGLHLLLHALLAFATLEPLAHRLLSLVAAILFLLLVAAILRRSGARPGAVLAGCALMAAMPGLLLAASLALGEVLAVPLLLGAAAHWVWSGSHSLRAALVTGLLLGLAAATRINLLATIPALLVFAALERDRTAEQLRRACAAAVTAAFVAALGIAAYYLLARGAVRGDQTPYLTTATGIGDLRNMSEWLNALEIANSHLPLLLLCGLVAAWHHARRGPPDSHGTVRLVGLLLTLGLAMLVAWVLVAPIPHLRYLWPAIACFWLAGTLLLLHHLARREDGAARAALTGTVLVACLLALVSNWRAIRVGDSVGIAYQAVGLAPRFTPRKEERYRAAAQQRRIGAFVRALPADALLTAPVPPVAYPIVYLSGRSIRPTTQLGRGAAEQYLILSPADYRVWYPGPAFAAWRERHGRKVFASGAYTVLRIDPAAPPPSLDYLPLGRHAY